MAQWVDWEYGGSEKAGYSSSVVLKTESLCSIRTERDQYFSLSYQWIFMGIAAYRGAKYRRASKLQEIHIDLLKFRH